MRSAPRTRRLSGIAGLAIAALGLLGCFGTDPGDQSGAAGTTGTWGSPGAGAAPGRGGRGGAGGSAVAGSSGMGGTTGAAGSAAPPGCGKEDCGSDCTIPALPAFSTLTSNEKLPDPFMMISGARIASRSEWQCRRAEIGAQIQSYEAGQKNSTGPGAVTGSVSGKTLTVNVLEKSFTVSITLPSGDGPFPAIIGLDGMSIPVSGSLASLGVAQISFDTNRMGNQSGSRGTGFFYDVNGDKSVGALMAWAWGVSRLIDALEITPAAKIDPKRIGVTGCSRNGKGALMVGAFDERIVLTIPQESGSGGAASWRVSYAEDATFGGTMTNHKVQTLDSAYGEQPWFGTALQQFGTAANVNKLPFDHHQLMGMVAPRGLMVLENTDYQWLGVNSAATDVTAAQMIYQALGVTDNIGFSNSGHTHCTPNSAEAPYVTAFIKKFLLNQTSTDTKAWNISRTAFSGSNATIDKARWVDWTVPTLE